MEQEIKEKKQSRIKAIALKWKGLSKKKKVACVVALVVLLMLGNALLGGMGKADAPIAVKTGTAEKMELRQEVSVKGAVSGTDSAAVYSSANYRIAEILVKEGDVVTDGQVLARLDAENLLSQYNQAAIAAGDAKRSYDTAAALYAEGAISKEDYLSAQSAYNTASLTLQSYNIEENANVTSPIAGTVTRVNTSVGKLANGSTSEALFVVENLEKLQMKVTISEFDISKIKVGQTVTVTAEVLGDEIVNGIVSAISPTGEVKSVGSTEMVIPIVIDVDKGETNLIAGVTAKATILTEIHADALTVPIDAILEDSLSGEVSVFTVKDGIISKLPVTILLEGDFYVAVDGDLAVGDSVVLAPTFDMVDGMAVTVY